MNKNITMKMLPGDLRPDEKFLNYGAKALSSSELLAIILRCGTKNERSVELASRILCTGSGNKEDLLNICNLELGQLKKLNGIGKVKAIQIKAIAELSERIAKSRAVKDLTLTEPKSVARYYMEKLRHLKREVVLLVTMDSACRLLGERIISEGTVNAALFSPREIFLEALKSEAVNIILLHNHPSGSALPSENDIAGTKRISEAGRVLGIVLLDHIIIGDLEYCSMKEKGYLNEQR